MLINLSHAPQQAMTYYLYLSLFLVYHISLIYKSNQWKQKVTLHLIGLFWYSLIGIKGWLEIKVAFVCLIWMYFSKCETFLNRQSYRHRYSVNLALFSWASNRSKPGSLLCFKHMSINCEGWIYLFMNSSIQTKRKRRLL